MSSHKQHQHLTAPQVPSRPSLSQSKTHNEPLKRLSIMETILSILIFATFFCVYMIIPSITINYYNRNNLTSDSDEYVDYIFSNKFMVDKSIYLDLCCNPLLFINNVFNKNTHNY